MAIQRINLEKLPRAGNYSHGIISGNTIYLSGQLGINQDTKGNFRKQFEVAIGNVEKILEASGSSLDHVIRVVVYLANASNFQEMNQLFDSYFNNRAPVRTTIICGFVNPDALVALEITASKP